MKTTINKLFLFILALAITSCSVQKRHYMSGYSITSHHKAKQKKSKAPLQAQEQDQVLASLHDEIVFKKNPPVNLSSTKDSSKTKACDTIQFKSGEKVSAFVSEIGLSEIRYKKCNNPDGPTFVVSKSDVSKIKYSNGFEEVIQVSAAPTPKTETSDFPKYDPSKNNTGPEVKTTPSNPTLAPKGSAPKMDILALLSMIFGFASFTGTFTYGVTGIVLGVLALVFGIIAKKRIQREPDKYKGLGMAKTGIICGIISLAVSVLILMIILAIGI
jgi:hypothetical protein